MPSDVVPPGPDWRRCLGRIRNAIESRDSDALKSAIWLARQKNSVREATLQQMEHLIPHLQYIEEDPDSEDEDFDVPQRNRTRASSAPPDAREMFMGAYRNIREINYESTSSSIDEVPEDLPPQPLYRNARKSQEREEAAHLRATQRRNLRHNRKFHADSAGAQAVIEDFLSNVSGSSTSRDSLPSLIQTTKESTAGYRPPGATNYLRAMPSASSTAPASQPTTKATYGTNPMQKNQDSAKKTNLITVFGLANDVFASNDRGTQYSPPHDVGRNPADKDLNNEDLSAFGTDTKKAQSPDRYESAERSPPRSPDRYDSAERDAFTENFVRSISGDLAGTHIHGIYSSKGSSKSSMADFPKPTTANAATSPSSKKDSKKDSVDSNTKKNIDLVEFLGQKVKFLSEKDVAKGSLVGARVSLQSGSTWWHAEVEDYLGDESANEYVLAYDSGHIKAVDLNPRVQKCVLLERVVDPHTSDATGGLVKKDVCIRFHDNPGHVPWHRAKIVSFQYVENEGIYDLQYLDGDKGTMILPAPECDVREIMVPHLDGAPTGANKNWRPARSRSPRRSKPPPARQNQADNDVDISPNGNARSEISESAQQRANWITRGAIAAGRAAALRGEDVSMPHNALPLAAAMYTQGGAVPGGSHFGTFGRPDLL